MILGSDNFHHFPHFDVVFCAGSQNMLKIHSTVAFTEPPWGWPTGKKLRKSWDNIH